MSSNLAFDVPVDDLTPEVRVAVTRCADIEHRAVFVATSHLKRMVDLFGAGLGLVVLAPFFLLVALLIWIETRGPVLFRQRRTGFAGIPFVIYKFRTMTAADDGERLPHATKDDCRTTRIGRFLRRTSLDELPQLLNVFRGEMSLVGPRPHALAHDRYYGTRVEGYSDRFLVKPGITGLAQISGCRGEIASIRCMADRVACDLSYIRRWSMGLDFWILVRTLIIGPFDPSAY